MRLLHLRQLASSRLHGGAPPAAADGLVLVAVPGGGTGPPSADRPVSDIGSRLSGLGHRFDTASDRGCVGERDDDDSGSPASVLDPAGEDSGRAAPCLRDATGFDRAIWDIAATVAPHTAKGLPAAPSEGPRG